MTPKWGHGDTVAVTLVAISILVRLFLTCIRGDAGDASIEFSMIILVALLAEGAGFARGWKARGVTTDSGQVP